MKIYILTSVALFAEYGDLDSLDSPSVQTRLFLSHDKAQKTMAEQLESERAEAEAGGYENIKTELNESDALFLNDAGSGCSYNQVRWEITEAEVPAPEISNERKDLIEHIHAIVCSYGRPVETGEPGKTGLITRFNSNCLLCIGGFNGQQNEIVDSLIARPDGSIDFDTEYAMRSEDEVCTDDLDYVLTWLKENADALPLVQEYVQPELVATKDVPDGLASFQVFPTREDCKSWMDRNGFLEREYTVETYHGDDIEEPTFLNGEGKVILEL